IRRGLIMQFGIGLLGRGYDPVKKIAEMLANTKPANISPRRASMSAAKVAAESILAEPPIPPDLTNAGIVRLMANCARAVRPSEAPAVRAAFIAEYAS